MANTETDPTETDATRKANRQYDWFTDLFANPRSRGYSISEPVFDPPPYPEERPPGAGERAPGPGTPRKLPPPDRYETPDDREGIEVPVTALPASVVGAAERDLFGETKPERWWKEQPREPAPTPDGSALPGPAAWTGPPPWAPSQSPDAIVKNRETGERWVADGDGWRPQTASTGEPGESGGIPAEEVQAALAALQTGGPALPEPQDFRAALETPEGGWDPTATAPDAAGAKTAQAPSAPAKGDVSPAAIEQMYALQKWHQTLQGMKEAALAKKRQEQERLIEEVRTAGADVRNYLERTQQPVPPELQKTPPKPDVKIRPWLDPEGKDAISVIAQTLGMLAVAAGGVAMKAPITAMQYFREAAEAWRRDEVDQANSKLKQFEMTMTGIKHDNEVALKQYELADKTYAHNLEAKKAFMLSKLDEVNLQDKLLQLTSKPYDEAQAAAKEEFTQAATIIDALAKLGKVNADLAKLQQEALPKNVAGAEVILAHTEHALRELPPDDPRRVAIQRSQDIARDFLKKDRDRKHMENANRQDTIRANAEIKLANEQLRLANFFESRVNRMADIYQILDEERVLPTSRAFLPEMLAEIKRKALPMSPRAANALRELEQMFSPTNIGMDRTFLNEKGNVPQTAWGNLKNYVMPITESNGMLRNLADMIQETRQHSNMILTTRSQILESLTTRDFAPAPAPVVEEE